MRAHRSHALPRARRRALALPLQNPRQPRASPARPRLLRAGRLRRLRRRSIGARHSAAVLLLPEAPRGGALHRAGPQLAGRRGALSRLRHRRGSGSGPPQACQAAPEIREASQE